MTFAEKSAAQIETDILSRYALLTGQQLTSADPRRIFIQSIVPIIAQQRVLIDFSAKQNLLGYSMGDFLDHLGASSDTERLDPDVVVTTMRFNLTEVLSQAKSVEAGIRVTAGDNIFFVLPAFTVPEGQGTVDIKAACTTSGPIGNGYAIGQINKLVKPLSWVVSVGNITESDGGADTESDDLYAERIHEAPNSFSVAGPDGAYKYWAKTANQTIIDVLVRSPSENVVEIRPLLQGGEIPGQEILDLVLATCNDRKVRPLTDHVMVLAPEQVAYDISLVYWIHEDNEKIASSIVLKVNKAIEDYKVWQKSKQGRAIDPSELITRVKNAGAKRVALTLPVYQQIEEYQVAKENTSEITYGGLADD